MPLRAPSVQNYLNLVHDENFRGLNKKKGFGLLFGGLYVGFCTYAIFSVEAKLDDGTKQSWLTTYSTSFSLDFFVWRLFRNMLEMALVTFVSKSNMTGGFLVNIAKRLINRNVLSLMR